MTQIILEHIDEAIVARLTDLARANRLSIEQQAQKLLVEAIGTHDRRRRASFSGARTYSLSEFEGARR